MKQLTQREIIAIKNYLQDFEMGEERLIDYCQKSFKEREKESKAKKQLKIYIFHYGKEY